MAAGSPNRTRVSPGSVSIGANGGIVRLGSNETATLGQVIPNATRRNSGIMTAAQADKLDNLTPGGGDTVTAIQTSNYDAVLGDVVRCDPSAGGFDVTLPDGSSASGQQITVKCQDATGSGNLVTIHTSGGDTVDGQPSGSFTLQNYNSMTFVSAGGTDWMII